MQMRHKPDYSDISAAIRPILMKFGMMMRLDDAPLNLTGNQKFQNNDGYFNFDLDSVSK